MSRFRLGIAVLLLLLVLGLLIGQQMGRLHIPVSQAMAEASRLALLGEPDQAADLASEAEKAWQQSRYFTAALADHQPLEDIDSLFCQLPAASDSPSDYAALCAELSVRIRAVADAHRLTISNLF